MRKYKLVFCSIVFAMALPFALWAQASAQERQPYLLGPMDKLHISVVEWQADQGLSRDWSAINGEYRIGVDGNISVPFIGELQATGTTTTKLAENIAISLRRNLGLNGIPQASVAVSEYRPVFVSGYVRNPGMFPSFPDMNVLKLVSVAGGISNAMTQTNDTTAALIRTTGTYEELVEERIGLLAKKARLLSEINEQEEIVFPEEIIDTPEFASIGEGERTLKKARKNRLEREMAGLDDLKKLLTAELETLEKKGVALEEQERLAQKEAEGVLALADKGLVVNNQIRSIQQFVSQTQATRLATQTDTLRAKQDLNKAERDRVNLLNDWNAELATELQEISSQLRIVNIKISASRDLIANAVTTGSAPKPDSIRITYEISRGKDGTTTEFAASETTAVLPGDVVKVNFHFPDEKVVGN
jgi:exopolysaccharide production protein ExoF